MMIMHVSMCAVQDCEDAGCMDAVADAAADVDETDADVSYREQAAA
jgi:hypothetical protein